MSNVIKSSIAHTKIEDKKLIDIKQIFSTNLEPEPEETFQQAAKVQLEYAKKELEQAKLEAERIIKEASDKAEMVKLQLQEQQEMLLKENEQLRAQAMEEGYEQGYAQGRLDGKQSYEEIIVHAQHIVETSRIDYLQAIEQAEPTIIDLAVAISQKIIGETFETDNSGWKHLLEQAINEVREYDLVKMYVHPDVYERTLTQKEELLSLLAHNQELIIFPDSKLPEFGCFIDTPFGQIDASVDSQLTEIKLLLHEKLKEDADERA